MKDKLHKRIKRQLALFMTALFLSGLTAIPVAAELRFLLKILPNDSQAAILFSEILAAYVEVSTQYHYLLYGYDWLAFAHFVLAILFIGPYRDPLRNIWVIEFGLLACVLVIPYALVAGTLRGLPFWWLLGDCSFGVIGFVLLWRIRMHIKMLSRLSTHSVHQKPLYAL